MPDNNLPQNTDQIQALKKAWRAGYDAGFDDGNIYPSGALIWASVVGVAIIIAAVIIWLLSHNF